MTSFMKKVLSWAIATLLLCTASVGVGAVSLAQTSLEHNQADAKTLSSTATGTWRATAGKWWYPYDKGGYARDGWQNISGAWYHFDKSGWLQIGWVHDGNTWYYTNGSGAMVTGWQKISGSWYYFASSGAMQTGWTKVAGAWYYLGTSGAMQTGWQRIGSTWYLLAPSGAMQTGWQKSGSSWYYLYPTSGAMAVNAWVKNYWLGTTGAMATNAWVDGGKYYVGADGLWVPSMKPSDPVTPSKPSGLIYDYEMQVLNPSTLYSGQPVILYVKTNNPDPHSIEIATDDNTPLDMLICEPYDDVRLADPNAAPSFLQKLASGSGYVATISLANSGSHGIRIAEFTFDKSGKPSTRTYTKTLAQLKINDYDAALNAWMDSMLAEYTTPLMPPPNKMEALCDAFDYENTGMFKFDPIIITNTNGDPNDPKNWRFANLISASKPFFESYTWDSLTAPTMLCEFAKRIGGFSEIHNCYYDEKEETTPWDLVHFYCWVDYKGEKFYYECVPSPSTNVIDPSSITYLTI